VINVIKEQKGDVLAVRLIGSVEENVVFDKLIGAPPAALDINCKEISRINSVGVKSWIKFFQSCQAKGTKLRFLECSTPIVEQMNLISNFVCNGIVESVYVPFSCKKCRTEMVGLFSTEDLKKMKFKLPLLKCNKCGGDAEFDDIPEEYFSFLSR
jgi:anti-anti-sigma regulatory factor